MKIILIGYMGSGKSHIGRGLAQMLKIPFVDLDSYIERGQQRTIADIFADKGETYFREIERKTLRKVLTKAHFVLSTGGGVPCFFDNMEKMNAAGMTIFLDASEELLEKRLERGKARRPIIARQEDLKSFIGNHLAERRPFYAQSKVHFPFDIDPSPQQVWEAIADFRK